MRDTTVLQSGWKVKTHYDPVVSHKLAFPMHVVFVAVLVLVLLQVEVDTCSSVLRTD